MTLGLYYFDVPRKSNGDCPDFYLGAIEILAIQNKFEETVGDKNEVVYTSMSHASCGCLPHSSALISMLLILIFA